MDGFFSCHLLILFVSRPNIAYILSYYDIDRSSGYYRFILLPFTAADLIHFKG